MNTDVVAEHPETEFARRLQQATPHVVVTPALVALNIAVFVVMIAMGIAFLGGSAHDYLRFGANFAPLTTSGEWWRLLTCTFVHFGIIHLAFNMWALWDCGKLTERLFGNGWFLAIYLFAGISGSLASMLWNANAISAGASGAVFGVFGALLAYLLRAHGSIPTELMNRLRISTSIFVTYSLFYGFAASGIDNAAHLGGLTAGFVVGMIGARPLNTATRNRGHAARITIAFLLAAVTIASAVAFAPDTSRVYREALGLQKAVDAFGSEDRRLNLALEDVANRLSKGNVDNKTAARELRANILPAWDAAIAGLSAVELDSQAPLRKDYELLLRYAHARREMTLALADFLESAAPADRQRFLDNRNEADAALKDYRARQAQK